MTAQRQRRYETLGILLTIHAYPDEVMGKYCLVEAVVPPGLGAPPNHHAGETEAFFVLEGAVDFMIEGEVTHATAGSYVAIPDGAVHAFQAAGESPARILIVNAPGNMHEAFFTELGTPVPADRTAPAPMDGPPDLAEVMRVAGATGMTLVPPAA